MPALVIILIIVALVVIWAIGVYNSLVKARQKVKNSWSQIEEQI